jgi:hypothetical protein
VPAPVDSNAVPLVQPMVAAFGLVFLITEGLMRESSTTAVPSQSERLIATANHALTISAISVIAAILTNVLREGVVHRQTALLTGANWENRDLRLNSDCERALVGHGSFSTRAKWRCSPSACCSMFEKYLTPPTL